MLIPCDAAAGSGRLMPMSQAAFTPPKPPAQSNLSLAQAPVIQFSEMTALMPPPIPATTNVPTPSGEIAATVPRPGSVPSAENPMTGDEFREMIPGEPDAPQMGPFVPAPEFQQSPNGNVRPMPLPEFLPPQNQQPQPQNPQTPQRPPGTPVPPPVLPQAPQFQVPANPLLPPGFQEFIDYENLQYLNGFLRTQIGKYMRVEQLVGSSNLQDRYGYLVGVGINYILLQELGTGNIMAVDYYGIKSVYVYYNQTLFPTS